MVYNYLYSDSYIISYELFFFILENIVKIVEKDFVSIILHFCVIQIASLTTSELYESDIRHYDLIIIAKEKLNHPIVYYLIPRGYHFIEEKKEKIFLFNFVFFF